MNAKQRNRLAMFKAVNTVFKANTNEFNAIAALAGFVKNFDELMAKIEVLYQVQQGNTTGARQLKLKEEAEMIDVSVQLAATMYVYAQVNERPDLQEKCNISVSQMERMLNELILTTYRNVHYEAIQLGDELADYGKTTDDISTLKQEIDEFAALISSPRSAIVTRSQATKELDILITEANDLLRNKVDKLMQLL